MNEIIQNLTNLIFGFKWQNFLFFTVLNLVYVIINTVKSITAAKADPRDKKAKRNSSWISTICYMWYTIILKQVAEIDLLSSMLGTGLSNYIGNYIGITITKRIIPRPIIKYKFTLDTKTEFIEDLVDDLEEKDFGYHWYEVRKRDKKYLKFTIYTKDPKQDLAIETLLNEYGVIHRERTEGSQVH